MLGCRTAIGVGFYTLAFGLVFACGGSVVHNEGDGAGRSSGGKASGHAGSRNYGGSGLAGTGGNAGEPADGGLVDPEPVETGCTVQELPPPDIACDPFQSGSCGDGMGCYPFVDHPEGSGCDQQRYGTLCLPAGQGTQGQVCGDDSGDWCSAGYVCVVGQRAGKRCAQLCELGAPNTCKGGLICSDLDVAGFGVCG